MPLIWLCLLVMDLNEPELLHSGQLFDLILSFAGLTSILARFPVNKVPRAPGASPFCPFAASVMFVDPAGGVVGHACVEMSSWGTLKDVNAPAIIYHVRFPSAFAIRSLLRIHGPWVVAQNRPPAHRLRS